MARHGTIQEFDSATEDWTAYSERLEQYFFANDVTDAAKKRAILLSVCGASTYKLIRSLVVPYKLTDKSYADIVSLLQTTSTLRQPLQYNDLNSIPGRDKTARMWQRCF